MNHEVRSVEEVKLLNKAADFICRWRDAGPECDCDPAGHSCGWPELRNLALALEPYRTETMR